MKITRMLPMMTMTKRIIILRGIITGGSRLLALKRLKIAREVVIVLDYQVMVRIPIRCDGAVRP